MDDAAYTIKDHLERIYAKLEAIYRTLDEKVDRATVAALEVRVRAVEDYVAGIIASRNMLIEEFRVVQAEIRKLEEAVISLQAIADYRRWLIATVFFGLVSATVGIISALTRILW